MRIYLACTVRGSRFGLEAARTIAARLQALGHDVLTTHLLDDDVDRAEASLTPRQVFERDLRWLESCDALVAEASGSSYGVGFEVGYVLGRAARGGQRAYVLYEERLSGTVSRLVLGNSSPFCQTRPYRSLEDLAAFIDETFGGSGVADRRPASLP